ncbi:MAG: HEAT repeat domain-containing protein [Gemmataceae bacterium]
MNQGKDAVFNLTRLLKLRDPFVRRYVAGTLGNLGDDAEAAVPALTRLIQETDQDPATVVAAVQALGRIGVAGLPALIDALQHPLKQVRREAVWAIKRLGPHGERAVPALIDALEDSDSRVRMGAAHALGSMGPLAATAVPALIKSLGHTNLIFCRLAAEALSRIGAAARPALEEACQHSDRYIRREASWALDRLADGGTRAPIASIQSASRIAPDDDTVPVVVTIERTVCEE